MIAAPTGHKFTPRSTPLHVAQLIMQLLRYTMESWSEDSDYPFKYTSDYQTTGVLLDTAFNKESKIHRTKPLVVVHRGGQQAQNLCLGDVAASDSYSNHKNKTTLVSSTVQVTSIGEKYAEVDLLASEMFNFLVSARTVLPGLTTIHRINALDLGPVSPFEEDTRLYSCSAVMSYSMQFKWVWSIDDDPLNGLGVFLNDEKRIDLSSGI